MRTLFALITAAALCLFVGCGSSSNSATGNDLTGTWNATIPAPPTTSTSTTSTAATSSSNAQPTTHMQFSFMVAAPTTTGGNGTGGTTTGGNTGGTTTGSNTGGTTSGATPLQPPAIGNSTPLAANSLQVAQGNGCFDSGAQVAASQGHQASGNIQMLYVVVAENGNQMTITASTTDGMTAIGSYTLTGATAGCTSDTGSVQLTRNAGTNGTNGTTGTTGTTSTTGH